MTGLQLLALLAAVEAVGLGVAVATVRYWIARAGRAESLARVALYELAKAKNVVLVKEMDLDAVEQALRDRGILQPPVGVWKKRDGG